MKELTNHQRCQFIVNKFCREPINWPKNYKIAKKLISLYDFSAFESMELPKKVAGLQFFLCPDGKEVIDKELTKKELIFPEKQKIDILDEKVGADYEEKIGIKSLMEFLN